MTRYTMKEMSALLSPTERNRRNRYAPPLPDNATRICRSLLAAGVGLFIDNVSRPALQHDVDETNIFTYDTENHE